MLDKAAEVVGPLRQNIRVCPEGGNDACNGRKSIQKYIYQKKGKQKYIEDRKSVQFEQHCQWGLCWSNT